MAIGLIVGTGMDSLFQIGEWGEVFTPYGPASISVGDISKHRIFFLRRHGPNLNIPPHLVNYSANIWALKQAGVDRIIATAAVGSLRIDISPGSFVVIDDFIDFTRHRNTTVYDKIGESVVHTDFTTPYCPSISDSIEHAAKELGMELAPRVTYVCVDGPRYETPAEVRMFAILGGDVIGMTGVPEVTLAKELGVCYGAIAAITNYAAGITDRPLSHDEVVRNVSEHRQHIHDLIERTISLLPENNTCCG